MFDTPSFLEFFKKSQQEPCLSDDEKAQALEQQRVAQGWRDYLFGDAIHAPKSSDFWNNRTWQSCGTDPEASAYSLLGIIKIIGKRPSIELVDKLFTWEPPEKKLLILNKAITLLENGKRLALEA